MMTQNFGFSSEQEDIIEPVREINGFDLEDER